jgi:hypothetical protein
MKSKIILSKMIVGGLILLEYALQYHIMHEEANQIDPFLPLPTRRSFEN